MASKIKISIRRPRLSEAEREGRLNAIPRALEEIMEEKENDARKA